MKALAKALDVAIDTPISPLTFDELHAVVLGGMGYWFGRRGMPLSAAIVASIAILDLLPESRGATVIGGEPWYFMGSLLVSYQVGRYS